MLCPDGICSPKMTIQVLKICLASHIYIKVGLSWINGWFTTYDSDVHLVYHFVACRLEHRVRLTPLLSVSIPCSILTPLSQTLCSCPITNWLPSWSELKSSEQNQIGNWLSKFETWVLTLLSIWATCWDLFLVVPHESELLTWFHLLICRKPTPNWSGPTRNTMQFPSRAEQLTVLERSPEILETSTRTSKSI